MKNKLKVIWKIIFAKYYHVSIINEVIKYDDGRIGIICDIKAFMPIGKQGKDIVAYLANLTLAEIKEEDDKGNFNNELNLMISQAETGK